jgi:hypothetical protein
MTGFNMFAKSNVDGTRHEGVVRSLVFLVLIAGIVIANTATTAILFWSA